MNPDVVAAIARLRAADVLSAPQALLFDRVARRGLVSVNFEIRALLYVGVVLLTSGVGVFLAQHRGVIGSWAIAASIGLAAAACLLWVARPAWHSTTSCFSGCSSSPRISRTSRRSRAPGPALARTSLDRGRDGRRLRLAGGRVRPARQRDRRLGTRNALSPSPILSPLPPGGRAGGDNPRRRSEGRRAGENAALVETTPGTARHYPLPNYRNDLKPARISSERNFGCSQAAKWPPWGSLL
jgi:hypothetical protein